jgi:hypothetical protein
MIRGRLVLGDDPGTMSRAGSGDDGKKRPWNLTSSQPNKSKKLSHLAKRALKALEHDDGVSSGDDERDAKDCQHRDTAHAATGASEMMEKSLQEKTATRSSIDTVRRVVAQTERGAQSPVLHIGGEAGRGFENLAHELYGEHRGISKDARGSIDPKTCHNFQSERNDTESCQNLESRGVDHVRNGHQSNEINPSILVGAAGSVSGGTVADNESVDSSPVAGGGIPWDGDHVCPHVSTSDYGDVLSCFMSTPFDAKSMLSLHASKEDTNTIGLQIDPRRGKNEDVVPIPPQKIFVKFIRERAVNAEISARVNAFLMQECQKLFDPTEQQGPIHDRQQLQQLYPSLRRQFHPNQGPTYFGPMQMQGSYYPMQQQLHHVNQQMNNWYYPPSLPAQLPHYNQGIDMQGAAYNNPAHTAPAQQYPSSPHSNIPLIVHKSSELHLQTDDCQTNSTIDLTRMGIELTGSNKDQRATSSVGLRRELNDTSKILVEAVTEKRCDVGESTVLTTDFVKQNENIVNGKIISSTGGDESTKKTDSKKDASINGLTKAEKSSAPRPRSSAILIESSDAPPGLPGGWTSKTFARAKSDGKGRDTYFYSVQKKIKFRSMKACKAFIQILEEPAIDGSESAAFKEFKVRGFKL